MNNSPSILSLLVLSLLLVGFKHTSEAVYLVPVDTDHDFSVRSTTFPLEKATFVLKEDVLTIRYRLPSELVHTENAKIEMSGTLHLTTATMHGDKGNGKCGLGKVSLKCHLFYPGLEIDASKVKAHISEHFKGEERKERLAVAEYFSEIPEGVILWEGLSN